MASYTEDQLITSDPRQLLEIEEAKQEFADSQDEAQGETMVNKDTGGKRKGIDDMEI